MTKKNNEKTPIHNNAVGTDARLKKVASDILNDLHRDGVDTSLFTLEVHQYIDNDHQDMFWYNGVIATAKYKDCTFRLEAVGDIDARLLTKNGKVIQKFQSKKDSSSFYEAMKDHLEDDDELRELLCNSPSKPKTVEGKRALWVKRQNWWKITVEGPKGKRIRWDDEPIGYCNVVPQIRAMLANLDRIRLSCGIEPLVWADVETITRFALLLNDNGVVWDGGQYTLMRRHDFTAILHQWAREYNNLTEPGEYTAYSFLSHKLQEFLKEARR